MTIRARSPARSGCARAALALLALGALAAPAAGQPSDWIVDPAASRIEFDYERARQPASGRFLSFQGTGRLDGADPGGARLEFRVQARSIDLGDALASAFATSAEWFDARAHPEIVYRLTGLVPLPEPGAYEALGDLTIRGVTRIVSAPVTIAIGAERAEAAGSLRVRRRDFGLGIGPSAAVVDIGPEVAVRFELVARPAP